MALALLSLSRLAAPFEPDERSPIMEAREAYDYWSRRASNLPWHKRAARREARAMVATLRSRLIVAHLERWRLGSVVRRLSPMLETRGPSAGAHVRSLTVRSMRRTPIGRSILLAASLAAAASVTVMAVALAVVAHLLGLF